MRVLLVNIIDETEKFSKNMKPLGLGYLVSYVNSKIDNIEFRVTNDRSMSEILKFGPDIIGITVVSQNYQYAIDFCDKVKSIFKLPLYNIQIIIGGIHISMMPATLHRSMDVGIIGEGEETFYELMKHYEQYGNFEGINHIDGILYHKNDELKYTNKRELLNVDSLPIPYRDNNTKIVNMFSSRGCPYNCVFCSSTRFWKKVRYFSAEYVVNEMNTLINNGVTHISFSDDLFIGDIERLREIVKLLPKTNVTIDCACRANLVTEEVIKLLKEINCIAISMGLESGCESTLKYLKGPSVTVEDNRNAIRIIKSHNITVNGAFIIGAPYETKEDILETLKFIKNNKVDNFWVYILTPLPGTSLWDYAIKRGLIGEDFKWEDLKFKSDSLFLSEKLTKDELDKLYNLFKREQKRKLIIFTIKNVIRTRIKRLKRCLE